MRGRVENVSAAHPTDLRPRGAYACLRYKTSHSTWSVWRERRLHVPRLYPTARAITLGQ